MLITGAELSLMRLGLEALERSSSRPRRQVADFETNGQPRGFGRQAEACPAGGGISVSHGQEDPAAIAVAIGDIRQLGDLPEQLVAVGVVDANHHLARRSG